MPAAGSTSRWYRSGTLIGHYRLGWLIGCGACADVYVAVDELSKRDVAVKVITEPSPLNANLRRVGREVRSLADVHHLNVLRVHDCGQHAGHAYVVTDFAPGGSLEERLARTSLPIADVLQTLRGIAAGLDHLHAHGIVHGDVKPANILFGSAGHPLVADFGVARLPAQTPLETPVLRDLTTFVGTPHYMAPEQIRDAPLTPGTDVYSLSVVAYRLLTGRLPFVAESSLDVMHKHLMQEARRPSAVRRDLPPAVDDVLGRGMAKDPLERWSGCQEMVRALGAALGEWSAAARRSEPAPERERGLNA